MEDNSIAVNGKSAPDGADAMEDIQTELDEETLARLQKLESLVVASLALWDGSIADEDEQVSDTEREFVDFDLYLADNNLLEVYAATVYKSPDDPPLRGIEPIAEALGEMAESGGVLNEVGADDDNGLVLVFAAGGNEEFLIVAPSGWNLTTWDELPDEDEEEEE